MDLAKIYLTLSPETAKTVSEVLRVITGGQEGMPQNIDQLLKESNDYKAVEERLEHMVYIGDTEEQEVLLENGRKEPGYILTRQGEWRKKRYLETYDITHSGTSDYAFDS